VPIHKDKYFLLKTEVFSILFYIVVDWLIDHFPYCHVENHGGVDFAFVGIVTNKKRTCCVVANKMPYPL
jgi:hypothetical protein